jgi:glycosyltransferase involved in cell wall biosynthesis
VKLVVATSFPVHPPRGGGPARIASLFAALAEHGIAVDIVTLVARGERARTLRPAPGLRELQVPRTPAHDAAEWALQQRAGVPVGDLALALHHELTPAYGAAIATAARDAAAVVASHPYTQPALAAATDRPLIYEAQDVEADLKAPMYEGSADASDLVARVRAVEAAACATAHHVIACTDDDAARLGDLYGVARERVAIVPNGPGHGDMPFTAPEQRVAQRQALDLDDDLLAVFVGSWHEPNLVVVRDLLRLAVELERARIVVLGSAGLAFTGEAIPANVDLCGVVDDAFLRSVLALAGAALNPMRWGSGTNLKMLDCALAGVPLVSTRFGARGLWMEPGRHYLEADVEELPGALAALATEDPDTTAARVHAARAHVRERFSWSAIVSGWLAHPLSRELLDAVEAPA